MNEWTEEREEGIGRWCGKLGKEEGKSGKAVKEKGSAIQRVVITNFSTEGERLHQVVIILNAVQKH